MKQFLYGLSIFIYTAAIFMTGMLVGQLYAVYVLIYTGAVFMIGMWIGQRSERRWALQKKAAESAADQESASAEADGHERERLALPEKVRRS
jgi:signal transduction histidine kinase